MSLCKYLDGIINNGSSLEMLESNDEPNADLISCQFAEIGFDGVEHW